LVKLVLVIDHTHHQAGWVDLCPLPRIDNTHYQPCGLDRQTDRLGGWHGKADAVTGMARKE